MEKQETNQRNLGVDVLKVFAMMMIVLLHCLWNGNILKNSPALSPRYGTMWFLEIAAYCAVNCYGLISGYVSYGRKFRYSGILYVMAQITFYAVAISALFWIAIPETRTVDSLLQAVFPVIFGTYWYATAYCCMAFLIPFLNDFMDRVTPEVSRRLVVTLVVLFSILPTIFQRDWGNVQHGYSVPWLICLYLLGAHIRKYGIWKGKNRTLFCIYAGSVVFTWASKLGIEFLTSEIRGEPVWGNYFVQYTSPTILICSVALLLLFSRIQISPKLKKTISAFESVSFGVYLIHDHPLIRKYVISNFFTRYQGLPVIQLTGVVLLGTVVSWLLCSGIDCLRLQLFKRLKIRKRVEAAVQRMGNKLPDIDPVK